MSILSYTWIVGNWEDFEYLGYDSDDDSGMYGFLHFFTYFILFNTMIPISLIVSLEMVKLA